jgi:hypothetical protein
MAYWYQLGPSKLYVATTTAEERQVYPSIDPIIAWGEDFAGEQFHGQGQAKMWAHPCTGTPSACTSCAELDGGFVDRAFV